MAPRIVLSGTFSALNKGDAAMQLATYRVLSAVMPGARITILSPFAHEDRATYPGWHVQQTTRRQILTAVMLLGRAALWWLVKRAVGRDLTWLRRAPELDVLHNADLLVDLSGDTVTEDYGIRCVVSHLIPIMQALLLGCPVVLCGQTIGPFGVTRALARFTLNRAALITVREALSFDYVRRMGVTGAPLYLTNDVAFLLEPAARERVDGILVAEGIGEADEALVGVTVSRLLGHRFSPDDPSQFEVLIAATADDLIVSTGATVVLIPHVTGPGDERDDRIMARAVYRRIRHRGKVRLIAGDYRPEELKGLIGRCQLFLGLRMHANIAALGMGVPTLAIAYSRKTYGIMAAAGQERWVRDIGNLTRQSLGDALGALWRQRAQVRDDLSARRVGIEQGAMENLVLIRRLLAAGEVR